MAKLHFSEKFGHHRDTTKTEDAKFDILFLTTKQGPAHGMFMKFSIGIYTIHGRAHQKTKRSR